MTPDDTSGPGDPQVPAPQQQGPGDPPISPELRSAVRKMMAAGIPQDKIAQFVRAHPSVQPGAQPGAQAGPSQKPNIHEEFRSGALFDRMNAATATDIASDRADEAEQAQKAASPIFGPNWREALTARAQAMGGGLTALGGQLPLLGPAQAGIRSVVRGQSYQDALNDLKQAEGMNAMTPVNRVAGDALGRIATGAESAAASGIYGGAKALLDRNDVDFQTRLKNTLVHGGTDFVWGGVANSLMTGARAAGAGALDEAANARAGEAVKTSDKNYDVARAEAKAAPATKVTQTTAARALSAPVIEPYVTDALNANPNAKPGEIIMSVYERISARQGRIYDGLKRNPADEDLRKELMDLGQAKETLLDATDKMGIPGMRTAVNKHAELMGKQDAGIMGMDVARRTLNKNQATQGVPALSGEKVLSESPAAFRRVDLPKMTPGEAGVAREDFLSRLHDMQDFHANPFKGFGVPMRRPTTTLNALDEAANRGTWQEGLSFPQLLKGVTQGYVGTRGENNDPNQ